MFSRFFVDRPVFATVLSVVIVIVGAVVALVELPVAQYPEIAHPPSASLPITRRQRQGGGRHRCHAHRTGSQRGGEHDLHVVRCTNDGQMVLDVTFKLGTNLDMAQVLVQNRVKIAEAKLPEDVKRRV